MISISGESAVCNVQTLGEFHILCFGLFIDDAAKSLTKKGFSVTGKRAASPRRPPGARLMSVNSVLSCPTAVIIGRVRNYKTAPNQTPFEPCRNFAGKTEFRATR